MQPSGTCSSRRKASAALRRLLLAGALTAGACLPCQAKVFMTQEEALKLAFPDGSSPSRQTAFLTDDQAARIEKEAGSAPPTRVIVYYTAGSAGAVRSAWFDTHIVRTLPETVMVVVEPDGTVSRIDILSFSEPEEYLPRTAWMDQLKGRRLSPDLSLRQGIHPLAGATLSARSIVSAARRALVLQKMLVPPPAPATPATPPVKP